MSETTADASQPVQPAPDGEPPPLLWRRALLRLVARAPGLRLLSGPRRLGPGRWRGAAAARAGAQVCELYLSETDGTVLLARADRDALAVEVLGELSETAALNLGDCLLLGLERGARRFDLDFGLTGLGGPEVLAVVESLARHLARQDGAWSIRMRAGGPDGTKFEAASIEGPGPAGPRTRRRTCSRA